MAPLLVLGALAGLYTAHLEQTYVGAHGLWWQFSFVQRLERAGVAWWFYLGKLAAPRGLSFMYPKWTLDPSSPLLHLAWTAAGAVTVGLVAAARRIGRGLPAGVLAYGVLIFPALGLANVYPMRYSFVADHFAYLAAIPVLALGATALARGAARWRVPTPARRGAAAVLLLVLGSLTWVRAGDFENRTTLWRATIAANPQAWIAYEDLGLQAFAAGRIDDAVALFTQAQRAEPREPDPYANLGNALLAQGKIAAAEALYRRGLALPPSNAAAEAALHMGMGMVLGNQGRPADAVTQFRLAIARLPRYPQAQLNLALALLDLGRRDEARAALAEALRQKPDYARARQLLAELEAAPRPPAR
jgi:tetratricopeptide (TPR) repeat protein